MDGEANNGNACCQGRSHARMPHGDRSRASRRRPHHSTLLSNRPYWELASSPRDRHGHLSRPARRDCVGVIHCSGGRIARCPSHPYDSPRRHDHPRALNSPDRVVTVRRGGSRAAPAQPEAWPSRTHDFLANLHLFCAGCSATPLFAFLKGARIVKASWLIRERE